MIKSLIMLVNIVMRQFERMMKALTSKVAPCCSVVEVPVSQMWALVLPSLGLPRGQALEGQQGQTDE